MESISDSKFIEINGFNVHYHIAGGGKPLIVLLHGSFLSNVRRLSPSTDRLLDEPRVRFPHQKMASATHLKRRPTW
jgi:pimeloyl-ACP methyl ester carboxylesterase